MYYSPYNPVVPPYGIDRLFENIKLVIILGILVLILIIVAISSIAKAVSGFKNKDRLDE